MTSKRIVVAGASGFIGSALAKHIGSKGHLIGLTRSSRKNIPNYDEVRQVDLFSKTASTNALKGADLAVYLVHSMMPAARLVQADFEDLDALCAENFAQAAAANGVQHIVYVGGLQPLDDALSRHLESRKEVENILGSHGVPVTTLRAGLIIGGNGSSLQILFRLIERLPVMVCPAWTNTKTNPTSLDTVTWAIDAVLNKPLQGGRVIDLGSPEKLSYRELMSEASKIMGRKRYFIPVPWVSPALSRLWVSLVTGAPKALVAPLVDSLRHEMVARDDPRYRLEDEPKTSLREMLQRAFSESHEQQKAPRAFRSTPKTKEPDRVLSVQRMKLPRGTDAAWAADEYMRWLPTLMKGLNPLKIISSGGKHLFRLGRSGPTLLALERSDDDQRRVYRVAGGLLAQKSDRGRLEFRQTLDQRTLIVAVHDFAPRLPWWIYRSTQALAHSWVMRRFRMHLRNLDHGTARS
jgi:uncharacterized protein YbjT (DUF2867 family)